MSALDPRLLRYIETHCLGESGYGYDQRNTRIAKTLMIEMVKSGQAAFLLLQNDEIAKWWGSMVNIAQKAVAAQEEKMRVYLIKKAAWDRLTPDERKILGLTRAPVAPKV
jgi:hypothetical protein